MIRAIFRAIKVKDIEPPFDTLFLKVFYPALVPQNDTERNSGILSPDVSKSPFPVVIFLNGVNCPPESYQWLAEFLGENGYVFVTFNWITDTLPGGIAGLTPGIDMRFMTVENYGKAPTGTAIQPILEDLEKINAGNLLGGLLDLETVHLGGHSAGGSVALTNANPQFFPPIKSVFAYAAHIVFTALFCRAQRTTYCIYQHPGYFLVGNCYCYFCRLWRYGSCYHDGQNINRRYYPGRVSHFCTACGYRHCWFSGRD